VNVAHVVNDCNVRDVHNSTERNDMSRDLLYVCLYVIYATTIVFLILEGAGMIGPILRLYL
jgi:hypothetical protein